MTKLTHRIGAAAMLFLSLTLAAQQRKQNWSTFYEESGGLETPRYEETMDYFRRLDEASPAARMIRFGISPEGRDLNLFIISSERAFTPRDARTSGKPIVFIQCCIHPGESEGKDAAMMLARDILAHKKYPKIPKNLTIGIIPIFNADGHERFGPYNRIYQNGPKEMGWRVTATRLNLNRDFVKADAPEMRAWLGLFNRWQPDFLYDCHTTDGADHQYVLTYNIDVHPDFGGAISTWAKNDFLPVVIPACESRGLIVGPYAWLNDRRHPERGLGGGVWPPMLSNPYVTLRNRGGCLIETHSLKPYDIRVQATYDFILLGLQEMAKHPQKLLQAVAEEDEHAARLGRVYDPDRRFTLRYQTRTDEGDSIVYRGYRFKVEQGIISGAEYLVYSHEPWNVPTVFYNTVEPLVSIAPPLGYLIPQEWTDVIDVVKCHGGKTYRLAEDLTGEFESYRFSDVTFGSTPYEGRQRVSYTARPVTEERTFKAGTVYVPLGCPESKIIIHLLEPQAPDALINWGFFNTIFEQREYFESYVMEPLAQKMVAENPELMEAFQDFLASDTTATSSPRRKLQFFYDRSPYADPEKDCYPVARVTEPLRVKLVADE